MKALRALARAVSAILKVVAVGLWVFAFFFVRQIIETRPQQSAYDTFPEFYTLMLVLAFLAPVSVGLVALGASIMLDIWLALNRLYTYGVGHDQSGKKTAGP